MGCYRQDLLKVLTTKATIQETVAMDVSAINGVEEPQSRKTK
jgi:hypothetical protein